MKIQYICLKNFASIYTATKKHKIEIDFSNSKNRVILLVGRNGTGKTSLLSTFHPFAYPGNMDVRNNDELILDKEDGYKEIHILDNDTLYVIKHHYIYNKNGRITKSYIAKDGVELNPNGNINSFKELIQIELSLELDYLKLIRLGSNVMNFIDMKVSDRKVFTSDLLSDIDLYTQFYKKINQDSRVLKSILKSVADKITKLKILDEKDVENTIHNLETNLETLKKERDDNNSIIWKLDGSINAVVPEGIDTFFHTLNDDEFKYKELNKLINHKESKLNSFDIIIMGNIDECINEIVREFNSNESVINTNTTLIDFYFRQLENFYKLKQDKENNLKYITSDLEYSKLTELFLELNREKDNFLCYNP
jgi:DNA repair exonuclease SbcCD ATPase subunit